MATAAAATTKARTSGAPGADRFTVVTVALAGFLAVLALMAWQIRSSPSPRPHATIVLRRIFETRVIETVVGAPGGGSSITQSASGTAAPSSQAPAPVTRAS